MGEHLSAFFKLARIERNLRRTHRRCAKHPTIEKDVCVDCTRVFCPTCGHDCKSSLSAVDAGEVVVNTSGTKRRVRVWPRKKFVLKTDTKYYPPGHLRNHWMYLQRMGATKLEEMPELTGAYWAVFPAERFTSIEELTHAVWTDNDFKRMSEKTAWAGQRTKDDWRMAFIPKEKKK